MPFTQYFFTLRSLQNPPKGFCVPGNILDSLPEIPLYPYALRLLSNYSYSSAGTAASRPTYRHATTRAPASSRAITPVKANQPHRKYTNPVR